MHTKRWIDSHVLVALAVTFVSAASAQERPPLEFPFAVSLAASATSPPLGEDAVFTATLSTEVEDGVSLRGLTFDDRSVCLEVTYQGFPWRYTRWMGKRELPAPIPRTLLTPTAPQTEQIPVLFPEVGTYEVTALYAGWSHQRARSNTITIEVQPVDEKVKLFVRVDVSQGEITGSFTAAMYPDCALGTVLHFLRLVADGFYDGTRFHRVLVDFVSQGGDPNSRDDDPDNDGQGGPGYNIPAEFDKDRFKNAPHELGALSMARHPQPLDSAGSQFFVCSNSARNLDDAYTCFGMVVEGLEAAESINRVATAMRASDAKDKPSRPVTPLVIDKMSVLLGTAAESEKR